MQKVWFHQLVWNFRQAQRRYGWVGVAAVVILICTISYYLSYVRPAVAHLEEIRLQAASLDKLTHTTGGASSITEQLSAFHKFFPESSQSPDLLAKIYAAAVKQKVRLGQGEYRLARDQGGYLLRYQIQLPVKAEYLQIRGFINQVLSELPNVSMDSISFRRRRTFDPVLDAQIELSIFMEE